MSQLADEVEVKFLSAEALRDSGAELTTAELLEAADAAWREIRAGKSFGSKAVLSLPEETFWEAQSVAPFRSQFEKERLGWKLSCLYSVNDSYGGVKVIGANAFNRNLGFPRSTSTILLLEKRTLRLLSIMDGTSLSARRTGTYATKIMDVFCEPGRTNSIFLFGTGPIARAVIECLTFRFRNQIEKIIVRGRSYESATRFVEELDLSCRTLVEPAGTNEAMNSCNFVVTATNARGPLFGDDELQPDAVTLHLGGDEAPEAYLRRALRTGHVVCDDVPDGFTQELSKHRTALLQARPVP